LSIPRALASVSNPVYTDTGIPVFGIPNTDTGKNLPVLREYKKALEFLLKKNVYIK
jgi:hypothetical protein